MRIGLPKETKDHEYRVALTPAGVGALTGAGHQVEVERAAGAAIGFPDAAYAAAGARIIDAAQAWQAELVVKVKEPQAAEYARLHAGQILFCYLHLAALPELTRTLVERRVAAIGFETVTGPAGGTPLLAPMSEIAGRLAPQVGAQGLFMAQGGRGVLLPGVPGVAPAEVLILGGGMVGGNAARVALGLGARVTVLDRNAEPLRRLDDLYGARLSTGFADADTLAEWLPHADLVIGAVLVPGRRAPRLLTRELLRRMRPGSALVDVSIDQGGIADTSRPTTHSAPFYVEEGVVHYCVTNMPGAAARTASLALAHAVLPYVQALADQGLGGLKTLPGFAAGLQVHDGSITLPGLTIN